MRPLFLRMAAANHIQPREALLLLTPGEVFGMFDLWAEQNGLKRRDDHGPEND